MIDAATTVATQLHQAFQGTLYPGDDNLAVDADDDPEASELAKALRGKDWTSVSTDMVLTFKDALPLLTPAAFRYYLPAYLKACIEARHRIDTAWDNVILCLTPPITATDERERSFNTRSNGFTPSQEEALVAFLEFAHRKEKAEWRTLGMEPRKNFSLAIDYWRSRSVSLVS